MQHRDHQLPGHRPRRRAHHPQPIVLQPGQVAYRVICHASIAGGLIGRSGSIISQIRRATDCTIRCEELVKGSNHRVIVVIGSASLGRRIALKSMEGDDEDEKELVSVAQEGVIRVCERMWEVDAHSRRVDDSEKGVSEGYCGLLADTTQIGAVVGRGGKNVVRMRRESGAQIRILPAPPCAAKDDELIQITGAILAVKKAMVAVTECLHDCPPNNKEPMSLSRPAERASSIASSDPHAEFFPHLSPLLPLSTENCTNPHSSSSDADEDPKQDVKSTRQEVSFRLLCSNGAAGSIIGKRGTIVRTLQNETGASIVFAAPTTMSGERVVTISAFENLESCHSPAQKAVILVFARSIEHAIEKGRLSGLIKGTTVTARLLVASDVVCCLNGDGGAIDSEMTELADIQIVEGEQSLDCASENDVVIEITGEYENVQNALSLVTRKLRDNLFPTEVLNDVRARSPHGRVMGSPRSQQSTGLSFDSDRERSLRGEMDQLGLSNSLRNASSSGQQSPKKFGKRHARTIKNNGNSSMSSGGGSELERSLHLLLPEEVLEEVGARSLGGVRETRCPKSHSLSDVASHLNQETILTKGNNQPGLSNNGNHSSVLRMPQAAGRGSSNFGGSIELDRFQVQKLKCVILLPAKVREWWLYQGHLIKPERHRVCFKHSFWPISNSHTMILTP
ncbi:KH domain-containing protein HEN4 isoform X2 [Manihot esculenta]|uniref:KH domain-containing protein HEN4 isoform X2 n=1 Tax=Manihot esculenta TaxID=3983 RepID=UPI001CC77E84|nr:KH domain-containing protein HEN4 isoform X2 [Manihot esculenta]